MILTGPEILRVIRRTRSDKRDGTPQVLPAIDVEPFAPEHIGPNSLDVRLGPVLRVYKLPTKILRTGDGMMYTERCLDMLADNPTVDIPIPDEGYLLVPGTLYLGSTVERTETHGLVPWFDGRSSVGRLGIGTHVTAGRGDDGFMGHWTLEITVVHPIRVYAGVRIGQISFFGVLGERAPYQGRYQNQSAEPTACRLWVDTPIPQKDHT